MRIIQLLPELNEGGVERGTVELNREFVKLGHESIVISHGGKLVPQIVADGGKHIVLDVSSKNPLTAISRMLKLRKVLKKIEPDVLHARSRVPAWLTYMANKSLHFPFVTTVHGFNSVNAYSKIMTVGDQVICASSFLVKHICDHYHTDSKKIHLIPRGIDFDYFNALALDSAFIDMFKKEHQLENKRIIVHVARITHWKDQATTIRAFLKMRETIGDIKLLLVGGIDPKRRSYFDELKAMVENSPYRDDVIFTGSQAKIKEIYSMANLAISASTKPETFGRANVEGLAMGIPLIATRMGATEDYVIDHETGFFFEPGDADTLASLMGKGLDYSYDIEKIKAFVRSHFSLDQMVEKTLNVYSLVVK